MYDIVNYIRVVLSSSRRTACVVLANGGGVVFIKQKTAYEMRISDWSSDVCSSDLHLIEDMLVAEVSVGEHIVADPLAGAQPAAMADHQPRFGPQHGEMVADRLGVRRADADVDQADAAAARRDQVIEIGRAHV